MVKVGKWIAKHKVLVLLIGLLLVIPSVIGIAETRVNYDLLSYLPDTLETVKGQDIKHKDLWQEIAPKMDPHLVFMRAGGHSYQLWMQEKLKKMVETPQETR
mgnify:FL=1